jgi:predicted deacylase
MVLIHAINPHGFAWLRRVTEDNVDLNRNFRDFSKPLPVNEAYEALQGAISGGQYRHDDGVFYGGSQPTWSNRTYHAILQRFMQRARHVAFIDLHTGLGPYGTGELICNELPGTPQWDELHAWYGEGLTSPESGSSSSAKLTGFIRNATVRALPHARVRPLTIEYGTSPVTEVLGALIADNWLHLKGKVDSDPGRGIKARIRRAFYPDESDWKELVILRARQILRRAAAAVSALKV